MTDPMVRPYRQQFSQIVPCATSLWLVVHNMVEQLVGVVPIVAYGREDRDTEYARSSRWIPLVLHEWTLVDAESIPGALGVVVGQGGVPPTEEALRALIEEE